MKKVIEGKMYNTETATKLASYSKGNRSDFRFWSESLYRTKSGVYFLAGSGGPMSHWCRQTEQNQWTGGEGIKALTEAEAREWVEQYANSQYEEIFGAVQEA